MLVIIYNSSIYQGGLTQRDRTIEKLHKINDTVPNHAHSLTTLARERALMRPVMAGKELQPGSCYWSTSDLPVLLNTFILTVRKNSSHSCIYVSGAPFWVGTMLLILVEVSVKVACRSTTTTDCSHTHQTQFGHCCEVVGKWRLRHNLVETRVYRPLVEAITFMKFQSSITVHHSKPTWTFWHVFCGFLW